MKRFVTLLLMLFTLSCTKERTLAPLSKANPYYEQAWYFSDHKQPDSSFVYFNKAKELALKDGDSIKAAKSLINMAIISGERGDFFGSQEISLSAIKYLNPNAESQREILSSNYNNLGNMASRLKNYQEAEQFYLKSVEFASKQNSKNIYLNNLAVNLIDQHKYTEALKYFNKLLSIKSIKDDSVTFSRILSNAAKTKWLQNTFFNPVPEFLKAFQIRLKGNDLLGQNASLAHLADFYMEKKSDSAIFYALQMYRVAQQTGIGDDQLYALERLIKLTPDQQSRRYFERFRKLEDSLDTDRNAAKNQFAVIRYETEKNKAENLNLQKENAEKKYQIIKQRIFLYGSFLFITGAAIIAVLWYKKRKQKLALEAEAAISENKLKLHKKVHDVVANGLYTVMSEIENRKDLDREGILDKMEILYEKSRDLTYEDHPIVEPNFREKINNLMTSFSSAGRRVLMVGNDDELWGQVSIQAKHEIGHILQELMVNMGKHSAASTVVVKFEQVESQVDIHYSDNGVGIKGAPNFKNGLTSTGNRIKSIGGEITFDANNDKGLSIIISFPIT